MAVPVKLHRSFRTLRLANLRRSLSPVLAFPGKLLAQLLRLKPADLINLLLLTVTALSLLLAWLVFWYQSIRVRHDLKVSVLTWHYSRNDGDLSVEVAFLNRGNQYEVVTFALPEILKGVGGSYQPEDAPPVYPGTKRIFASPLVVEPGHVIVQTFHGKFSKQNILPLRIPPMLPQRNVGIATTYVGRDGGLMVDDFYFGTLHSGPGIPTANPPGGKKTLPDEEFIEFTGNSVRQLFP